MVKKIGNMESGDQSHSRSLGICESTFTAAVMCLGLLSLSALSSVPPLLPVRLKALRKEWTNVQMKTDFDYIITK